MIEPERGSGAEAPGDLRTSISSAAQRIDEVVEAAERVALELREEAQVEGERYLAQRREEADRYFDQRRQEADRLLSERAAALSQLSDSLIREVDDLTGHGRALAGRIDGIAEEFRRLLQERIDFPEGDRAAPAASAPPDVQQAPEHVEAGDQDRGPESAVGEPESTEEAIDEVAGPDTPVAEGAETEPRHQEALEPPPKVSDSRSTDEALLRATQMAIAGESRDNIGQRLRSEFGIDDPDDLLDQVLGPGGGDQG